MSLVGRTPKCDSPSGRWSLHFVHGERLLLAVVRAVELRRRGCLGLRPGCVIRRVAPLRIDGQAQQVGPPPMRKAKTRKKSSAPHSQNPWRMGQGRSRGQRVVFGKGKGFHSVVAGTPTCRCASRAEKRRRLHMVHACGGGSRRVALSRVLSVWMKFSSRS